MKNKTAIWTFTAALAGFLFGFDTVVISGANQPIKELWGLTPLLHGTFIMSMALWGTVVGALFGGIPSQRFGRKPTLVAIGVLYFISAVGSGLAPDPISFSIFRFIGGLAVGASSVAAPAFISEIAMASKRGRLVAQYQFNIVLGIFIAFLSNYVIAQIGGEHDWRWMLGVEAVPALLYILLVLKVPESPRWLVTAKKDSVAALAVLNEMFSEDEAKAELESIIGHQVTEKRVSLMDKKYRRPIVLAFLLAFFNQWSGVNFIFYYAPQILELSGFATSESLLSSISIGGINLIFTLLGMYLIDKLGRKTLLVYGSIGYIISLIGVAMAFKTAAAPSTILFFLCLFIASHAIGQGAVIWVFIAEIFPNKVRAYGQSFGSGVHWVMAAIITLITPVFLDGKDGILKDAPWVIFVFFAGMMVLQLVWVLSKVPETKGRSLEELQEELTIDN
ncbi:MAG: sugar porter family MFS transporter [Bacteroidetes bacterium]|jgi:sugar porter (SP) family MFS transporter|nr:sugar porter family MFS transporter [Bacteroidota bacterium]